MSSPSFRTALYAQIEPAAWNRRGLSPLNRAIVTLILLATLFSVLETEPFLYESFPRGFSFLEGAFAVVFLLEYLMRLYAVGENPRYAGWRGRLRYAFSFWAIIDLLAFLPYFLTLGSHNAFLVRLLRLLRILRLARLGRYSTAWKAIGEALLARRFELALASGMAGLLLLVSSSILYAVESRAQPEAFGSIPRVMWWSVATLTTVGYGDVTPVTPLGRIMAGFTALSGIGLIALPTGILAAAFSDAFQRHREATECKKG